MDASESNGDPLTIVKMEVDDASSKGGQDNSNTSTEAPPRSENNESCGLKYSCLFRFALLLPLWTCNLSASDVPVFLIPTEWSHMSSLLMVLYSLL